MSDGAQARALVFEIADWLDLVVNEWHYYVGGNQRPDEFMERAKKLGWKPENRSEYR